MTRHTAAPILVFSRGNAAIESGPLALIGSYRGVPSAFCSPYCYQKSHAMPVLRFSLSTRAVKSLFLCKKREVSTSLDVDGCTITIPRIVSRVRDKTALYGDLISPLRTRGRVF